MKKLISVFIYLLLVIPSQAGTIYVDANATGANNGSSWADAYKYLQDALTVASSGTEIWVAQGVYWPDEDAGHPAGTNNRDVTFQLKNNVALYGGFPTGGGLLENRDPNTYGTILSGDINVPEDYNDNSYHVVTGSGTNSTAILDGFTITKGSDPHNIGGGMYNSSGSPTVTNCTFTGNWALDGGGIYNDYYSSPTVTNCSFASNCGGGMYNDWCSSPTVTNCTFTNNLLGTRSGGMCNDSDSNPTLTNCTFTGNWAIDGGGMDNYYSDPNIVNCTFSGNWAVNGSGGMRNYRSSPTITNCTFSTNSATNSGGGMCNFSSSPTLTNCTFIGNSAKYGGGMYNSSSSSLAVTNCTFSTNSATNGGGGIRNFSSSPIVTNCILWGNSAPTGAQIYNNETSTPAVSFSDVQGGYHGLGNIDADPCFVDADANDYHLKSEGWRWDVQRKVWTWDDVTSRCIDAGNPGSPLGDELLSVPDDPDNIWGQNLRIDMGAFGGTAEASIPPYDWALLADLTNDGLVGLADFAYQAADWLNSADQQPGDLNRDSLVDISDLALLIEDWLEQTTWH